MVIKPNKEDSSTCFWLVFIIRSLLRWIPREETNHFCTQLFEQQTPLAHKVDPLENEIRELSYQIEDIKNEQEYTVARERTHRDSTWSLGDAFIDRHHKSRILERLFEPNAMFLDFAFTLF